ncbi:MAG: hypothetical protein ACRC0U_00890 [Vibrio sp.]
MRKNQIIVPRAYIERLGGNYIHAAVLSELESIAKTYSVGEPFPLAHEELGNWLYLTADQIRYSIRAIKAEFGGVVQTQVKKFNGTPTTHYFIDIRTLAEIKGAACQ